MYQILQKFDIHWHDGGPSIAMMYHLRRVSDLLCNWKSCLLCYMKDVVLHCSIFFKWNKLVRVREFEFEKEGQDQLFRQAGSGAGVIGIKIAITWTIPDPVTMAAGIDLPTGSPSGQPGASEGQHHHPGATSLLGVQASADCPWFIAKPDCHRPARQHSDGDRPCGWLSWASYQWDGGYHETCWLRVLLMMPVQLTSGLPRTGLPQTQLLPASLWGWSVWLIQTHPLPRWACREWNPSFERGPGKWVTACSDRWHVLGRDNTAGSHGAGTTDWGRNPTHYWDARHQCQ